MTNGNVGTDRSLLATVHVLVDDSTKVEVHVDVDRQLIGATDQETKLAETIAATIRAALNAKQEKT